MANERHFYLREWREYRGLTQEQLASGVGMTKGRVSEIERGVRRYNETMVEKLAKELNCQPWELIGRDPSTTDGGISDLWARIRPEDRAQALRTLESFVRGN
jgi:transcriptional regulator with XRE-family HTH domain